VTRRRPVSADEAAAAFLAWLGRHELSSRPWTVDEVWFLASADFAPASGVVIPPRNRFLGALQRQTGVSVQYDKRVRVGATTRKTTVYTFDAREDAALAA
jgi:hypothetical protein